MVTGVLVFTSTPDKAICKYYLGPAPMKDMAHQIAVSSGPCGKNKNYLFLLEKALREIGYDDEYVIELVNQVRKIVDCPKGGHKDYDSGDLSGNQDPRRRLNRMRSY